jgi:hypothetical protein
MIFIKIVKEFMNSDLFYSNIGWIYFRNNYFIRIIKHLIYNKMNKLCLIYGSFNFKRSNNLVKIKG